MRGTSSRAGVAALVAVLCAVLPAGCPTQHKLSLRHAEHMAWAWLHNVRVFLDSPPASDVVADERHEATDEEPADDERFPMPDTLRDCFVDDGWEVEGFRNPTEAIAWLTERRRSLGRVLSIDLVDDSAEVAFELNGEHPVTLVARVVMADGLPKCKGLTKAP